LIKTTVNQFYGGVGLRDDVGLNTVDELRRVRFQEVKDGGGLGRLLDEVFPPLHHLGISLAGGALGFSGEEALDVLSEFLDLSMRLGIVSS
jgi:hypothetical protein